MMRDVAYRQDAVHKKPFYEFIIKHHRSWLDFAHSLGHDISLSDLILIDGCDRTSEWACAAWFEMSQPVRFNFVAGALGIADGGASLWGRWVSPQSLDKNVGPRPPVPAIGVEGTVLQLPSSCVFFDDGLAFLQASSPVSLLVPPPPFNQCVFLRGFQMGDRATFFKHRKKRVDLGSGIQTVLKPSSRAGWDWTTQLECQTSLPGPSQSGTYLPSPQSTDFRWSRELKDGDADGSPTNIQEVRFIHLVLF